MNERLEKWVPIEGISDAFISAELWFDFPNLGIRLIDGRVERDQHRDLVLLFKNVAALRVHEEFVHPTQETTWGRKPAMSELDPNTFPCLIVYDSSLLKELRDELEINYRGARHYRLCTGFPVVDVITNIAPEVSWLERAASAQDAIPPHWARRLS